MTADFFFIAEVGPNHNGDVGIAKEMIFEAAAAGANAVKFQTYSDSSTVVSHDAPLADYMKIGSTVSNQAALLDKIRLTAKDFEALALTCEDARIEFMSTPFDPESVDVLLNLGVKRIKVPSGEVTNSYLLDAVARADLPIIMSTGMSTFEEIDNALKFFNFFENTDRERVALLHCTSSYPTPIDAAHLNCIPAMLERYECPVGFSDHTIGFVAPIAAIALGASVIEKHVTFDVNAAGPDHKASLELSELPALIKMLRDVCSSKGSAEKALRPEELDVTNVARRSLAVARKLSKGHLLTTNDLTALRPAGGINPMERNSLVGKRLARDYEKGELLRLVDLND
ncbi:N-acetylneuraminate synthase family protein [Paracoccaceae bacterium]|nr:N-acetylneuraminate synthase family protein [Paracoccaceae bacterium]